MPESQLLTALQVWQWNPMNIKWSKQKYTKFVIPYVTFKIGIYHFKYNHSMGFVLQGIITMSVSPFMPAFDGIKILTVFLPNEILIWQTWNVYHPRGVCQSQKLFATLSIPTRQQPRLPLKEAKLKFLVYRVILLSPTEQIGTFNA